MSNLNAALTIARVNFADSMRQPATVALDVYMASGLAELVDTERWASLTFLPGGTQTILVELPGGRTATLAHAHRKWTARAYGPIDDALYQQIRDVLNKEEAVRALHLWRYLTDDEALTLATALTTF